jgi:hypothetical protein
MRAGRRPAQVGQKGLSNHRWRGGGQLCVVLNPWGLLCAWDCATANVYDTHCHPLLAPFDPQMILLTDTGLHAQPGEPANMKSCPRGPWHTRMLGETVLSMLTTVCHSKTVGHRVWAYFRARVAWTMAVFNLLARWGLAIDDEHMVRLSIAEFSLYETNTIDYYLSACGVARLYQALGLISGH